MSIDPSAILPAAADSARAVTHVSGASLVILLPIAVAALAAILTRRSGTAAGPRALIWRSAVVVLFLVWFGRLAPSPWTVWILPPSMATPLIALGRIEVSSVAESSLVRLLLLGYSVGVILVLVPLVATAVRLRRLARWSDRPDQRLERLLTEARARLGLGRSVRLLVSARARVPMTWGLFRPVVLLPVALREWDDERVRAILLHELAHVAAADAGYGLVARLACALYWFHPGVWWVARRLRSESERASDDRVLSAGVRASDYARLLADACDRLAPPALAMAASGGSLRERLASIVDPRVARSGPSTRQIALALVLTLVVAIGSSAVRFGPTRAVLDDLIHDSRWESRAYAVLGLARRPDSIAVARSIAVTDPSPRVRAWARFALFGR